MSPSPCRREQKGCKGRGTGVGESGQIASGYEETDARSVGEPPDPADDRAPLENTRDPLRDTPPGAFASGFPVVVARFRGNSDRGLDSRAFRPFFARIDTAPGILGSCDMESRVRVAPGVGQRLEGLV